MDVIVMSTVLRRIGFVDSSKEVVKSMTQTFAKVLEECKKEVNLSDNIMQEFYNFWKEDFQLVNRELGCAVMCMASKYDLATDDNKLHRDNAHDFAKKHGADDEMAQKIVTLLHECENVPGVSDIADDCSRVLEITKCFKTKMHELKWAPTMEVAFQEVMTEV